MTMSYTKKLLMESIDNGVPAPPLGFGGLAVALDVFGWKGSL